MKSVASIAKVFTKMITDLEKVIEKNTDLMRKSQIEADEAKERAFQHSLEISNAITLQHNIEKLLK